MSKKKTVKLLDLIAPPVIFEESGYGSDDNYYSARSLYAQAAKEKCRPRKLMLRDVDFSQEVWRMNDVRIADYAYNARRALEADLSIPIIVSPIGGIMDGFHRILGALLKGEDHVMQYRLNDLPEPNIHPDPDVEKRS